MGAVGVVAGGLLAVIFAWAAIAKFAARHEIVGDFSDMGLPAPQIVLAGVIVAEVGAAGLLLAMPRWGAALSIALLVVFSAVLMSIMRSGKQVRCGCFGANHREPVSIVEVARNGALGVIALLALGAQQGVAPNVPAVMIVSLTALCLLLGVSLVALAQKSGALFRIELAGEIADLARPGGDAS